MDSALQQAQRSARELANNLGLVRDGGGVTLREYTIRYRIVVTIDGRGETCEHCQLCAVELNAYLRTMDGEDVDIRSCRPCLLPVIDGEIDTDPSYIVTVEVPQ